MKNRYKKLSNGYIFDNLIFRIALYSILLFLFYVAYDNDFNFSTQIYVKCDPDYLEPCSNPYYRGITDESSVIPDHLKQKCIWDWCSKQYLEPGFEFGKKPTRSFNLAAPVSFGLLILAFIINHFKNNKDFDMEVLK